MNQKFISDIIPESIIRTFKKGEKYLIEAQTGSGKSHWVKNTLYKVAKKNGSRILLLSNRIILKEQNKADLGIEKLDTITLANYQYIERQLYDEKHSLDYFYNNFLYVVFDESHFFAVDSLFSNFTDSFLETINNVPKNIILILITATPQVVKRYNDFKKENIYTIPSNYDYIQKITFYNKKEAPEILIRNLPDDERAIFFGSCKNAHELSNKFNDAVFVCSESNKSFYKNSMQKTVDEIVNTSSFANSGRILCTTSVLDNGVNIKDPTISTVIIESLQLITFLQELGRRRVMKDDEKINLYVRNQDNSQIKRALEEINTKIKTLSDLENMEPNEFIKKYRKLNIDSVIDHSLKINIAKAQMLFYLQKEYEKMLEHPDGYKLRIYELLGIPHQGFQTVINPKTKEPEERLIVNSINIENEKLDLLQFLEKYEGKKLDYSEQEEFKLLFFDKFIKHKNYRNHGMKTINSILEEANLEYRVISTRNRVGNREKNTFWNISYST